MKVEVEFLFDWGTQSWIRRDAPLTRWKSHEALTAMFAQKWPEMGEPDRRARYRVILRDGQPVSLTTV